MGTLIMLGEGSTVFSSLTTDLADYASGGLALAGAVLAAIVAVKWLKKFGSRAS